MYLIVVKDLESVFSVDNVVIASLVISVLVLQVVEMLSQLCNQLVLL
jgi:hypothetical protein